MSFSTLPSELILAISYRIPPDTIEAYGRTCRGIREIATPLIKEHRQLLSEYTKAELTIATAAKTLYAICARPWIRLYPTSLDVMANRNWRSLERPKNAKQRLAVEEVLAKRESVKDESLTELIESTGLIPDDEINTWIQELERGNEDFLFALLIALLPNLRRLTIHLDHEKLEQVKEMIRRIRHKSTSTRALSNVETVRVVEKQASGGACDLEMFPLLAALPSVVKLHGQNLVGMYRDCYRDGWLSYPGACANITHISLETCGMSVEGLEKIMKSIKNLQSFRYIAHRAGWGLHALADLLKQARTTLHTLEITAGSGKARCVGSLRQFTALKHLTLDTDMVMKNGRMQRAVDILPASIERVTLCGNNLTEIQEANFLSDLYRPSYTYPCLKSIGVEDSFGRRLIGKDRLKFQKEFHSQKANSWMLRYR